MDKNEYRAKLDEIEDLVNKQDYKGALKIAETIDWRRVRSARTLCMVGEIYEANQRYDESRKLLLLAHQRAPIGRTVIYRLVELAIKMGNFDEAAEYYKKFVELSPNDNSRYVLKYKICRAKRSPIEEQISILQEYKSREYTERWAYELARLYAKAGMKDACVEECDDLILWFSEGKYVNKAMDLKRKFAPLSPSQQDKYDKRIKPQRRPSAPMPELTPVSMEMEEVAPRAGYESRTQDQELEEILDTFKREVQSENYELGKEPEETTTPPEELSIFMPRLEQPADLEDKVTQGMRHLFHKKSSPAEEEVAATQEAEALASPEEKGYVIKELEPENLQKTSGFKPFHVDGSMTMEVKAEAPKSKMFHAQDSDMKAFRSNIKAQEFDLEALLAETANELAQAVAEETKEEQEKEAEKVLLEKTKDITIENLQKQREAEKEAEKAEAEAADGTASEQPAGLPAETESEEIGIAQETKTELPSEPVAEIPEQTETEKPEEEHTVFGASDMESNVPEEQPRALREEAEEKAQDAYEPQAEAFPSEASSKDAQDMDTQPEERKDADLPSEEIQDKANTQTVVKEEAVPSPAIQDKTEAQPETFMEAEAAEGLEEAESSESVLDTSDILLGLGGQEPVNEQAENTEAAKEYDEISAENEPVSPEGEEADAASEEISEEIEEAIDELSQLDSEVNPERASVSPVLPAQESEQADLEEEIPAFASEKEDSAQPEAIQEAEPEAAVPNKVQKSAAMNRAVQSLMRHHLTEEEHRRLFTYFAPIPGMSQQINEALDIAQESACVRTSQAGNIIVTGREGSGKTRLSEGLIKALCKERKREGAKVAYLNAEQLNEKDPVAVVDKMSGGFLVVENAGELNPYVIENMSRAMEFKTDRLTVILEDSRQGIHVLEEKYPEFMQKFDCRIVIPVFTNDELVSFAKTYAKELGYKIDDMAVLALYTLIGDNQNEEHPVAIGMVREMMDEAIKKASRKGRRTGKKVSKRHLDETGRIMLYEKDFNI